MTLDELEQKVKQEMEKIASDLLNEVKDSNKIDIDSAAEGYKKFKEKLRDINIFKH